MEATLRFPRCAKFEAIARAYRAAMDSGDDELCEELRFDLDEWAAPWVARGIRGAADPARFNAPPTRIYKVRRQQ